ncbi:hypothetical protein [Nocardioides montaniterrae]
MTIHAEFPGLPERATWPRVIKDQRKVELTALGLMIFCLWFRQVGTTGQLGTTVLGGWALPVSLSAGIFFGLANHLVTERWLLGIITSGGTPTKAQLRNSTIFRLAVLTLVGVGFAAAFWPDGVGALLGLAIFRLIALVMTTIPLLKELKNQ